MIYLRWYTYLHLHQFYYFFAVLPSTCLRWYSELWRFNEVNREVVKVWINWMYLFLSKCNFFLWSLNFFWLYLVNFICQGNMLKVILNDLSLNYIQQGKVSMGLKLFFFTSIVYCSLLNLMKFTAHLLKHIRALRHSATVYCFQ